GPPARPVPGDSRPRIRAQVVFRSGVLRRTGQFSVCSTMRSLWPTKSTRLAFVSIWAGAIKRVSAMATNETHSNVALPSSRNTNKGRTMNSDLATAVLFTDIDREHETAPG